MCPNFAKSWVKFLELFFSLQIIEIDPYQNGTTNLTAGVRFMQDSIIDNKKNQDNAKL